MRSSRLPLGPEDARAAVIRALAAIGPTAAARAADPLGRALLGKIGPTNAAPTDGYRDRLEAAIALGKMGESGFRPLLKALKEKQLPGPVAAEVCKALGALGPKARPAVADLSIKAEQAEQRPAVSEVLTAIGGDAVIDGLIRLTNLSWVV
jgi:hypothetical protein